LRSLSVATLIAPTRFFLSRPAISPRRTSRRCEHIFANGDPFERTGLIGSLTFYNWYAYEFWRFVFVKDEVGRAAQTFLDFPPTQKGASFNLEALKQELEKKIAVHQAQ